MLTGCGQGKRGAKHARSHARSQHMAGCIQCEHTILSRKRTAGGLRRSRDPSNHRTPICEQPVRACKYCAASRAHERPSKRNCLTDRAGECSHPDGRLDPPNADRASAGAGKTVDLPPPPPRRCFMFSGSSVSVPHPPPTRSFALLLLACGLGAPNDPRRRWNSAGHGRSDHN